MISWKSRSYTVGESITTYFSYSQENIFAPSRWQVMTFLLILITSIALSLSNYDSFQLGSYMDDASYAVLAKSIVHSHTYGLINTPGQPASTRYPFGFP